MEFPGNPEAVTRDAHVIEHHRLPALIVGDALGLEGVRSGTARERARRAASEPDGGHRLLRPLDRRAAGELGCRPGVAAFRSDRVSVGPDGTPIVYDRVFIPGDRFRITRNIRYDVLDATTSAVSSDAPTGPIAAGSIASREAVRMSAEGAKEPDRQTEVFHVQPL